MSTPLTDERLAEIRSELEVAGKELGEICQEGPSRRWRMRIPANADDSDLVLSAGIVAGEELLAEVERLKAARPDWADVHALLAEHRDSAMTDNEITDAVVALWGEDR